MKEKEKEYLQSMGCEEFEGYCLVNNYGYTFKFDGKKYDIRYWANCYGVAWNKWECMACGNDFVPGSKHPNKVIEIEKYFNDNFR